jgi:hypothetical protein
MEDYSWKPAQANSSWDPISKKTLHKNKAGGVAEGGGSEFKPQYHKNKKKGSPDITRLIRWVCNSSTVYVPQYSALGENFIMLLSMINYYQIVTLFPEKGEIIDQA